MRDQAHDPLTEIAGATAAGGSSERLAALVDGYARRVYPAVLEQHAGASVSSPLGVWLLLAACVSGAGVDHRAALEEVLGCSADDAGELLAVFLAAPPPALKAAIAVWVSVADSTEELAGWVRGLPGAVESGFMPTQGDADAWAEKNTLGLIESFPLRIDAATRIVLASALATKVSWQVPFEVVPASEHLGEQSPWRAGVERLLWDREPAGLASIADTRSAGLVAVHQAVAEEDLTVISVSADPDVPRAAVLDAAHEVAAFAREGSPAAACSLFDLPLGSGHSWQITERETRTYLAGERVEQIAGVSLPSWHMKSRLDLQASELFGAAPALEVMRELIGPRPDDITDAAQVSVASFTRDGFEAAAITEFMVACAFRAPPQETGTERVAILRFDHPYAAVAISGRPTHPQSLAHPVAPFTGLPLFSAWVEEPREVEQTPPPGPTAPRGRRTSRPG